MIDLQTFQKTTRWAQIATLLLVGLAAVDIADWLYVSGQVFIVSPATIDLIVTITSITDFAILALMIVCLRWIFVAGRYYQNRAGEGSIRPHWAVWSNFVPFLNLWSPYVQIKRIWKVSAERRLGDPVWLKIWWGAWGFQFVAAIGIAIYVTNIQNLGAFDSQLKYIMPFFIGFDILATVLFYRVVTEIGAAFATDADIFD